MEWLDKLQQIVQKNNDHNPTVNSMMFMLNNMIEEYGRYKELGTVEQLAEYKRIAQTRKE